MRALIASLVVVGLSACGGLENEPLTLGIVRGSLERASASGWVAIAGRPTTRQALGAGGTFEFRDLQHGEIELFGVANDAEALRRTVAVEGGGITQLGQLAAHPGGFVSVDVKTSTGLFLGRGTVEIPNQPWTTTLDILGHGSLGPLPVGCWDIHLSIPGAAVLERQACTTEGGTEAAEFDLVEPDGTPGHEGCAITGCQDGLECGDDRICH